MAGQHTRWRKELDSLGTWLLAVNKPVVSARESDDQQELLECEAFIHQQDTDMDLSTKEQPPVSS